MDIIFLRDLRIETIIGIYDWERRIKQTVSLDDDLQIHARQLLQRLYRELCPPRIAAKGRSYAAFPKDPGQQPGTVESRRD